MAELTNQVPLSATRITLGGAFGQGERLTHLISIVNSGSEQYTGLCVEDGLGFCGADGQKTYLRSYVAGTAEYYVNGVLQASPAVTDGPPLAVLGLTVPAGGNVTVVYQTEINGSPQVPAAAKADDEVRMSGAVAGDDTAGISGAVAGDGTAGISGAGVSIRAVDIRRGRE